MMYVIGIIAVLWFICWLVDTWQASKTTLHYECHRKLLPNGFVDAATGNARVDRAQSIQIDQLVDSSDVHNHLPLGTYRVGLRWDDTTKDYRATAQIATWVLHW